MKDFEITVRNISVRIYKFPTTNTTKDPRFTIGELYLFNRTSPACPAEESLWGVFDKKEGGTIYLESSSLDLKRFRVWHPLPVGYRYIRLATRAELRDYEMQLSRYEYHMELRHLLEKTP